MRVNPRTIVKNCAEQGVDYREGLLVKLKGWPNFFEPRSAERYVDRWVHRLGLLRKTRTKQLKADNRYWKISDNSYRTDAENAEMLRLRSKLGIKLPAAPRLRPRSTETVSLGKSQGQYAPATIAMGKTGFEALQRMVAPQPNRAQRRTLAQNLETK